MTQTPPPYDPAPAWSAPAPSSPRLPVGLIALAIALATVLVGILGFALGRLTAPLGAEVAAAATTRTSSTAASAPAPAPAPASSYPTVSSSIMSGFRLDGTTLTGWTSTGATFTTTLPDGWRIGDFNGGNNSGQILNNVADTIDYFSGYERTASDNCTHLMLNITSEQYVVKVPGHTWAGKPATAVSVKVPSDERKITVVLTYVCVDTTAGHSDLLRLIANPGTNDTVMAAADTVLNAWTWN